MVAGPKVGGGLCPELAFFLLQPLDLRHQPFAETGVRRQALVVVGDLPAQVLLLHFQQRFRILPLQASDEETQEAAEEIGDSSEHGRSPFRMLQIVPLIHIEFTCAASESIPPRLASRH